MLSIFPDLLSYGLLAPFLIRAAAGIALLVFAHEHLARGKWRGAYGRWFRSEGVLGRGFAIIYGASGFFILAGLFTQAAAIPPLVLLAADTYRVARKEGVASESFVFRVAVFFALLSLLFSGAGFFAIDLPL